ncbi:hypothetical protein RCL1_006412 [Eukaryota sp. TZLM3-RCL]
MDTSTLASLILAVSTVLLLICICLVTYKCLAEYREEHRLPNVFQTASIRKNSFLIDTSPEPCPSKTILSHISRSRSLSHDGVASPPPPGTSSPISRERSLSSPSPIRRHNSALLQSSSPLSASS